MQGQASGVNIIHQAHQVAVHNIRIRGITSIGSTAPLVIIDGTQGSMSNLNVNDIESIQVLKDAGAAAIYGVRGSNGVVVVTTKSGRSGKVKLNYDSYYGAQVPFKNGFNIANTQETANAIQQSYINSGLTPVINNWVPAQRLLFLITLLLQLLWKAIQEPILLTYKLYDNQITRTNKQGTVWFDEIFSPAPIQSHNISASTGR